MYSIWSIIKQIRLHIAIQLNFQVSLKMIFFFFPFPNKCKTVKLACFWALILASWSVTLRQLKKLNLYRCTKYAWAIICLKEKERISYIEYYQLNTFFNYTTFFFFDKKEKRLVAWILSKICQKISSVIYMLKLVFSCRKARMKFTIVLI